MDRALETAATGMQAQQINIDLIANNLSNINTTAFKKSRANFTTLFSDTLQQPGAQQSDGTISPNGVQVGLGVELSSTQMSFGMGNMSNTGNPLDIAIEGDGFFQVQLPDGSVSYTRDGNLQIDGQTGELVSKQGYAIFPSINFGSNIEKIVISADGQVSAISSSNPSQANNVGNIRLVRFANPAGLLDAGDNMYKETLASGNPQEGAPMLSGLGKLRQGFLEQSNVQVVEEIVNMISAQRAYEANSNVIKAADQMLQQANNMVT